MTLEEAMENVKLGEKGPRLVMSAKTLIEAYNTLREIAASEIGRAKGWPANDTKDFLDQAVIMGMANRAKEK